VTAGTITSGQGTSSITVDTTGLGGQSVTATVDLGGLDPYCAKTASSCPVPIGKPEVPPVTCDKSFDDYEDLKFNDEKARLDNFAIKLQSDQRLQGYYVIFGSCDPEAVQRSERAVGYLVNTRGIDQSRITVINGGCREKLTVELWTCPAGAAAPVPANSATVSPCPSCKPTYHRKRRPRRRYVGSDE
jgi:hypothetical protein